MNWYLKKFLCSVRIMKCVVKLYLLITNYFTTMLFNSCVCAVLWFEHFRVFLFNNWQHTSCILVCCTLRHFLFLVHIEFLSCFGFIRFSNRKKSAGLLCIWKYNRWFIFEYVFVKFIHIVYFVYSYMYI